MGAMRCSKCGSYAINPQAHGRDPDKDLDLCDVCYYRVRNFSLEAENELLKRNNAASFLDQDAMAQQIEALKAENEVLREQNFAMNKTGVELLETIDTLRLELARVTAHRDRLLKLFAWT